MPPMDCRLVPSRRETVHGGEKFYGVEDHSTPDTDPRGTRAAAASRSLRCRSWPRNPPLHNLPSQEVPVPRQRRDRIGGDDLVTGARPTAAYGLLSRPAMASLRLFPCQSMPPVVMTPPIARPPPHISHSRLPPHRRVHRHGEVVGPTLVPINSTAVFPACPLDRRQTPPPLAAHRRRNCCVDAVAAGTVPLPQVAAPAGVAAAVGDAVA